MSKSGDKSRTWVMWVVEGGNQHVEEVLKGSCSGIVLLGESRKLCKVVASRVLDLTGLVCGKDLEADGYRLLAKAVDTQLSSRGVGWTQSECFLTSNE